MLTSLSSSAPRPDARTRAAWQSQMAAVRKTPGLLPFLVRQRHDVLPRFATAYHQLRALPKWLRRRLQRHWHASLGGLALLLTLGQAPALAVTINVDGTGCTLVDAITAANTNALVGGCDGSASTGADTLVLEPSSVHTLTAVDNTTYGPTGLPVVSSEITIEGNGSTIQRTTGAQFRILAVNATGHLTLQETTISGGIASGAGGDGGGIFNTAGTVTLSNSAVSGNTGNKGGGVFTRAEGSGLSAVLTVINSTLSGNTASVSGGGVFNEAESGASTLTLTNSTFSGNTASVSGGGVFNEALGSGARAEGMLTNSTFSGNRAGNVGGGLYNSTSAGASTLTLINSTVSRNKATFGGGVFNGVRGNQGGKSTLRLTNSTLSGNTADSRGGGVYNAEYSQGSAKLTLSRSLLSGNTAPTGAEVCNTLGTIAPDNDNLLGHSGLTTAQAFSGFTPKATDLTATSDGTTPTALASILTPTLANNGGPTLTHNLVPNSPAIEAFTTDCPATDQRGFPRPVDGDGDTVAACDLGAVEYGADPCTGAVPTTGCTVNSVADQRCEGTSGDDIIIGTSGDDIIVGKDGNDTLKGKGGQDLLCGGDGNDTLDGGGGNDTVEGGAGDDILRGKGGEDLLLGGEGADQLRGGKDTDSLDGGPDTDLLQGGPGIDTCQNGETLAGCE